MKLDGMSLLFGDDQAELQRVQQGIQAPAPRYRPGEEPGQPRAATPRINGTDLLFGGGDTPQAQTAPQAMPAQSGGVAPEADAPTWLGRRIQDVRGKQDPRYQNAPNIARVLQDEGGHSLGGELFSWTVGASDEDMAKTYQAMLGRRFIGMDKDANGYPLIVYQGKDGSEQRAYVNNPGLDAQDVARGGYGAIPYIYSGLKVGQMLKNAPPIGRIMGQFFGQGATSLAQDATAVATGVSELDPVRSGIKAGVSATGGAVAEFAGMGLDALVRRFITEPRYFNSTTGQLTQEGIEAARKAGVDPADITNEMAQSFGREMARLGDPEAALRQSASNAAGIRRTAGELSGDRNQLLREQQMRGGVYGQNAREAMENFDRLQQADIARQVAGGRNNDPSLVMPTIPERIAPRRVDAVSGGQATKSDTGSNIRANTQTARDVAKAQERQAWEAVPRIKATDDALPELDNAIASQFSARGGVYVDDVVTPVASKMAQAIDDFKAGKVPSKVASVLPDSPAGDVGTMRKRLLGYYKSAQSSEDKRAAKALYDAFLDWEVTAAEKAGNHIAAAQARTARQTTRELREIFDGEPGTSGANIMKSILGTADSPEGVVNALFTGPTSQIKNGSATALQQLRRAYDKYLEPQAAKAAWDDVRLAYWLKVTMEGTNAPKTPGVLAKAIKTMEGDQASIANTLFTVQERAAMRRLARALDQVKTKNPNTSWSAVGVGALAKDAMNAVLAMLGGNTVLMRTFLGTVMRPVQGAYGAAQAAKATGRLQGAQLPALPGPSLGGFGGAAGGQSQQ